jgi:flagellar protein FlgJ
MSNSLLPAAPMPMATSTANTYTDVKGLAALKKDSSSPQALHAIAQQVDALFLQMMLKSMRDAGADQGGTDSNEMGMYQDMFDKQIALTLSQHQGLGLGSLLTRQLSSAAAAPPPAPAGSSAASAAPAPATAPSTTMLQTASEFVSQMLPTITRAAKSLGVSPLGMLAQAALETGWGTRMARTAEGAPSLNMFGIKADDSWEGARAGANTVEFSAGVATQQHTAFRAYGSIEESVSDFANLLKGSPRYRQTVAAGGNAQAYVNSIGQSGYATDPQYSHKLNEILNGGTLRMALNAAHKTLEM